MLVTSEDDVKADGENTLNPTLLILAAGRSTRYGRPKALVPVGPSGETLIDYAILDSRREGFGETFIVTQPGLHDEIAAHLQSMRLQSTVRFLFQDIMDVPPHDSGVHRRTKPWGTGHAVLAAREVVTRPFVVVNCDDFYGREAYHLAATHLQSEGDAGAMVGYRLRDTLSPSGGVSRAVCRIDDRHHLTDMKEVLDIKVVEGVLCGKAADGPAMTLTGAEIVSMNFWVFHPSVFVLLEDEFLEFLSSDRRATDAEFYLSEAIGRLTRAGRLSVQVLTTSGPWVGITRPEDLEVARSTLRHLTVTGAYPGDIASTPREA